MNLRNTLTNMGDRLKRTTLEPQTISQTIEGAAYLSVLSGVGHLAMTGMGSTIVNSLGYSVNSALSTASSAVGASIVYASARLVYSSVIPAPILGAVANLSYFGHIPLGCGLISPSYLTSCVTDTALSLGSVFALSAVAGAGVLAVNYCWNNRTKALKPKKENLNEEKLNKPAKPKRFRQQALVKSQAISPQGDQNYSFNWANGFNLQALAAIINPSAHRAGSINFNDLIRFARNSMNSLIHTVSSNTVIRAQSPFRVNPSPRPRVVIQFAQFVQGNHYGQVNTFQFTLSLGQNRLRQGLLLSAANNTALTAPISRFEIEEIKDAVRPQSRPNLSPTFSPSRSLTQLPPISAQRPNVVSLAGYSPKEKKKKNISSALSVKGHNEKRTLWQIILATLRWLKAQFRNGVHKLGQALDLHRVKESKSAKPSHANSIHARLPQRSPKPDHILLSTPITQLSKEPALISQLGQFKANPNQQGSSNSQPPVGSQKKSLAAAILPSPTLTK